MGLVSNSGVERGAGILDKLCVIIFLNYFEQLLLGYIAYLLIVNHLTVLPRCKVAEMGPDISFMLWCVSVSIKKIGFQCVLCHNYALFSSLYLHYLNCSHPACECSNL